MFAWMVPGKIVGCWDTIDIMDRSVGVCRFRMSTPPREIVGAPYLDNGASYRDSSNDAIVDLPDPERPTIAVHESWGMVMKTFRSARASDREGYRKFNFLSFTGATLEISTLPRYSWDAP